MKNKKLKGALWNTLGSAMYGLNSFVMLALVSRVGSVEEAGAFGIAFTTAQSLYIVGLCGVPHYHMTDYDEKYSFSSYAKARVLSSSLMLLCCFFSIAAMGFTGIKRTYTVLLSILMLLNVVGELYQALFFQKNRLDLSGSALFFRTLWSLIVFCIVTIFTKNILFAVIAQITANLVVTMYYSIRVAPQFIIKKSAAEKFGDSALLLLVECFPLAISLFLKNIVINMSKYGIEFTMDDTIQGYYSMIFMPAQVINLCSQFIIKPFLKQYANLIAAKDKKAFFAQLSKHVIVLSALTAFCCVAARLLGVQVLGFIYGKDLSGLEVPLTLVVLGGGLYAICQLFYYILVIMRHQRRILIVYIVSAAVSAVMSLAMISNWGILGAVLAFVVTHVLVLLGYWINIIYSIISQKWSG